jgi:hypothetical protein
MPMENTARRSTCIDINGTPHEPPTQPQTYRHNLNMGREFPWIPHQTKRLRSIDELPSDNQAPKSQCSVLRFTVLFRQILETNHFHEDMDLGWPKIQDKFGLGPTKSEDMGINLPIPYKVQKPQLTYRTKYKFDVMNLPSIVMKIYYLFEFNTQMAPTPQNIDHCGVNALKG